MCLNQGKTSLLNIKEKFLQQPWPGRGIQAWGSLESPSVQPFRNRFNTNLSAMTDDPCWGREGLGGLWRLWLCFGIVERAGDEHPELDGIPGGAGEWGSWDLGELLVQGRDFNTQSSAESLLCSEEPLTELLKPCELSCGSWDLGELLTQGPCSILGISTPRSRLSPCPAQSSPSLNS